MAQVRWAWSKGRRSSGAVLHSSRELGVRRLCSDFMDMLRCLINCRIIIVIISSWEEREHLSMDDCLLIGYTSAMMIEPIDRSYNNSRAPGLHA